MAFRKRLEDSAVARTVLKAVAVLGVCLMVAGMCWGAGPMTAWRVFAYCWIRRHPHPGAVGPRCGPRQGNPMRTLLGIR
jgi:hypothetical protein